MLDAECSMTISKAKARVAGDNAIINRIEHSA
jgi:hypothetical protein